MWLLHSVPSGPVCRWGKGACRASLGQGGRGVDRLYPQLPALDADRAQASYLSLSLQDSKHRGGGVAWGSSLFPSRGSGQNLSNRGEGASWPWH